ncbi:hypothetical protein [Alkalihalobacillus sp. AL-G]|uniref:hypothetical protein n=1 Tax=Alkalihalobacillus sp. AL-G TaxID=2926399 RepID=UPI0027296530|nr:hypothetical protein [Alkalihalobacillus sp. AL-G]WLD91553.1 hypothetical protein MOJ78_10885 [Alkalihalobacillus sp. AL-G]
MTNRNTYYVSPKGDILPVNTDIRLQLFEVAVSDEELNRFRIAVKEFDSAEDVEKEDFFNLTHFKEVEVDEHRRITFGKLVQIYKWIYTHGTATTKFEIEKMNILPKLEENARDR